MREKYLSYGIVFNRILKLILALPLVAIMAFIVMMNVKLSYKPSLISHDGDTLNHDLIKALRGLKQALADHADDDMQAIYPEGNVFLNAIYALAWSDFLQEQGTEHFMDEGRPEMREAWKRIDSSTGRAPFTEELPLPYGAFYTGWSSYVLGSRLRLEPADMRSNNDVIRFKQQCEEISRAIRETVYPMSYYGNAWPADATVGVASLALHDKLFEPEYEKVIDEWISGVKKRLDIHGMIPHSVHPADGNVRENARGSSMALMLIFLQEIDAQFAKEQFKIFKDKFLASRLGLTGMREYPKGAVGYGDVDSGPVILGFGGAATIVGMKTIWRYGEEASALRIRNAVEALAFPFEDEEKKKYLFGSLPMADAFIAWSHSDMTGGENVSFTLFRVYSFSLFTAMSFLFWSLVRGKRSAPLYKRSVPHQENK